MIWDNIQWIARASLVFKGYSFFGLVSKFPSHRNSRFMPWSSEIYAFSNQRYPHKLSYFDFHFLVLGFIMPLAIWVIGKCINMHKFWIGMNEKFDIKPNKELI